MLKPEPPVQAAARRPQARAAQVITPPKTSSWKRQCVCRCRRAGSLLSGRWVDADPQTVAHSAASASVSSVVDEEYPAPSPALHPPPQRFQDRQAGPGPPHASAQDVVRAASEPVQDGASSPPAQQQGPGAAAMLALIVLSATYVHQAAVAFGIPVMAPMISSSLHLSDLESAVLTSSYSYMYALALIPMGILADRVSKPLLLGSLAAVWSTLSAAASHASTFSELMGARVCAAAAQSAQNVVSFSVIPDLFPKNRSTAMSAYNTAIYLGRGAVYLGISLAQRLGPAASSATSAAAESAASAVPLEPAVVTDLAGNLLVPLSKIDLRLVQVMYLSGDMAAIRATSSPVITALETASTATMAQVASSADLVWRQVLEKMAIPGFLLAAAVMAVVPDTRKQSAVQQAGSAGTAKQQQQPWDKLLGSRPFVTITLAASCNDLASYALTAWQSTFYERCFHLQIDQYAPVLATVLPLAGIIGGVGGGLVADRLTPLGLRPWVTVGCGLVAAPLFWLSLIAHTPEQSYAALALAFGLSETWRAPAAVMARSVAPSDFTSTASGVYLCVRNLIGGLGPLIIAQLAASGMDLRDAMQVLPVVYALSALGFAVAERLLMAEQAEAVAAAAAAASTGVEGALQHTSHQ